MTVHNGDSAVRVRQFVMIAPARINESGLFQPPDKFVHRHNMTIRIMRIESILIVGRSQKTAIDLD